MNKSYANTFALYVFCSDYHVGQESREYRLLCKLQNRLRRAGFTSRDITSQLQANCRKTPLYRCLESAVIGE